MEKHVATSCDSTGFKMLVPFLASLRGVAKWAGNVLIIDLGMNRKQVDSLTGLGMSVIPAKKDLEAIVCQRFDTLADYASSHPGIYAHWDADVWFTGSIEAVFDLPSDRLSCTIDRTRQGFVSGVVPNKPQAIAVDFLLDAVQRTHSQLLQVGFVCGGAAALRHFANVQRFLIKSGFAADAYGTDTLALNLMSSINPDVLNVVDIGWNCIPDWQPEWRDGAFHCGTIPIKVLHQTSPWRNNTAYGFKSHYPDSFQAWRAKLGSTEPVDVAEESRIISVTVGGIPFACRDAPYWDHTILYHALNDYSLPDRIPDHSIVLDIGAHIGGFSKRIAVGHPNVIVHAFEPDKENFDLLRKNMGGLSNVHLHNEGVYGSDAAGNIVKPCKINTGMHRVILSKTGSVKLRSINSIVDELGKIAYLKMDCEGAEWSILDGISPANLLRIQNIQGEFHHDLHVPPLEPKDAEKEIARLLKEFNVTIRGQLVSATRNGT